jgi:hypothetical protein
MESGRRVSERNLWRISRSCTIIPWPEHFHHDVPEVKIFNCKTYIYLNRSFNATFKWSCIFRITIFFNQQVFRAYTARINIYPGLNICSRTKEPQENPFSSQTICFKHKTKQTPNLLTYCCNSGFEIFKNKTQNFGHISSTLLQSHFVSCSRINYPNLEFKTWWNSEFVPSYAWNKSQRHRL